MGDATVRTYDPNSILVTFGTTIITGFAAGTFVKIMRNGAAFEKVKGACGDVDRINRNANDFKVELTLKQSSPVNAILSGLLLADQISNAGTLPLLIKDLNGTTLFAAMQAWIEKDPDAEFADKLSDRVWSFETGMAANLVGGNN